MERFEKMKLVTCGSIPFVKMFKILLPLHCKLSLSSDTWAKPYLCVVRQKLLCLFFIVRFEEVFFYLFLISMYGFEHKNSLTPFSLEVGQNCLLRVKVLQILAANDTNAQFTNLYQTLIIFLLQSFFVAIHRRSPFMI